MPERQTDSYSPRVREIRRLRLSKEWTIETLADKSDVPKRTVERICSGQRGSLRNFAKIAEALGTTADKLFVDRAIAESPQTSPVAFQMRLEVAGALPTIDHSVELARAASRSLEHLDASGIAVHDSRVQLAIAQSSIPKQSGEHGTYILVGLAWWSGGTGLSSLALVREEKYREFFDAVVDCTLDFDNFETYGRLFPPALQRGGPWPVIQAAQQPRHGLDQKRKVFTVVDMPQTFQYVRPSDRDRTLHSVAALAHCNRVAEIAANECHDDPCDRSEFPVEDGTYICCVLGCHNSAGTADVPFLVKVEKYNDFVRAVRSRTLDLDNCEEFGRIHPTEDQWPGHIWDYLKRDKPLPHSLDLGTRCYWFAIAYCYYVFLPGPDGTGGGTSA